MKVHKNMGERRVQSSYIPPDFNPSSVSRKSKPQNGQHDCRFMLPMSIQCNTCGDYMHLGTKANSRKEVCYNEFYLGIPVYRFYIHCKACYAEIIIKTDPKNTDYIIEKGATSHFEPWKEVQKENAEETKAKLSGSCISQVETSFHDINRDVDQTTEVIRLSEESKKRRKISARQLEKIHKEEAEKQLVLSDLDMEKARAFEKMRTGFNSHSCSKPKNIRPLPNINHQRSMSLIDMD